MDLILSSILVYYTTSRVSWRAWHCHQAIHIALPCEWPALCHLWYNRLYLKRSILTSSVIRLKMAVWAIHVDTTNSLPFMIIVFTLYLATSTAMGFEWKYNNACHNQPHLSSFKLQSAWVLSYGLIMIIIHDFLKSVFSILYLGIHVCYN